MIRLMRVLLPLAVLAAGGWGAWLLVEARRPIEELAPPPAPPLVEVMTVRKGSVQVEIRAQGTVEPRTEIELVPEVAGRILETAPGFEAGGFFEKGELLARIDPRDFEYALAQAQAAVAQARKTLEMEQAEAEVARQEWEKIGRGTPSPLAAHEPQLAEARASLEAAGAVVAQRKLDLERTRILAPFAGRVRKKNVDVGQFVARGTPIATLYAVDFAEVRLPIRDEDLAFLELPLDYRGQKGHATGPPAVFRARFGGRMHSWKGRIVRTEGEIDPRTRMVVVVGRVENPYGRGEDPGRPPFSVGMFVQAEIQGRTLADVARLPRRAVRPDDEALVVSPDGHLRIRRVEVLRREGETLLVRSGLADGEQVVVSPLETVVDGMSVKPLREPDTGKTE